MERGNQSVLDRLLPLVYAELRRIAARYMAAQRPTHTLQPTDALKDLETLCPQHRTTNEDCFAFAGNNISADRSIV